MSKWIRVDDRLPILSSPVLLWLPKQRIVDTGYRSPLGLFVLRNLKWGLNDVTHWMPLPEPPSDAK
ncbi:hypothetical protein R84981_002999 [Carnimonas sp. R-84981]|uniref:DUF551 domain-containing protein n=1 Tax=Carnimonas bestiolae TaxID=3402172 RepID=UPI003EDC9657